MSHTLEVAQLYYEDGLTKSEIAGKLRLSRFKVARLLEEARRDGTVRIEIRAPIRGSRSLERSLEAQFGLERAIVVETNVIPRAAAALLRDLVDAQTVLGVAWGETLSAVAAAVDPSSLDLSVVQICGAVPGIKSGAGPTEVAWRFAERFGGVLHSLPAPAFASGAARDELLTHEAIAPTVVRFPDVTIALVGIGARARGGHILVHAFDRDGVLVETEMRQRSISMSAELLQTRPTIAVAGGAEKRAAVRGALRTGLLKMIVTDETCAQSALK